MATTKSTRRQAIQRRNLFLVSCIAVLLAVLCALIAVFVVMLYGKNGTDAESSAVPSAVQSQDASSGKKSAAKKDTRPQFVERGGVKLDAVYSDLRVINGRNPLPADYDYEADLTTIPDKYINGSLKQINKNVWPYMQAMLDAARADGINLAVWSPYRSYDTQNMLFRKQVQRCLDRGVPADKAEEEAATVVARPGTSEHNTGLAADFNMADDKFESTPMFAWMQQHAADYGFILRYPKSKQEQTGVIYESWHYRFVGIYEAQAIKESGLCLEEYVKQKK